MKVHYLSAAAFAALLLAGNAQAGSMSCGASIIDDGQPDGQFKQQILAQCGEPTSKDGDNWFYNRADVGQGTYILHFNDSGQLESIDEQIAE